MRFRSSLGRALASLLSWEGVIIVLSRRERWEQIALQKTPWIGCFCGTVGWIRDTGRRVAALDGVDGALTPPAHRGRAPHGEKRPHVYRYRARLGLAVAAARSARTTSGPCPLRAPRQSRAVSRSLLASEPLSYHFD